MVLREGNTQLLAYLLGLLAGAASPTQASVNGRVREDVKSTYITSIISFTVATVLMAVIMLAAEHSLYIPLGEIAKAPLWIWLGGTCGTIIVTLNIICLPHLGSANNVMLICFGQIMTGLIVDHFGLFFSPQVRMSLVRFAGAVLVILGIALVNGVVKTGRDGQGEQSGEAKQGSKASLLLYILLAAFNGFACASQIAINGALKTYAGSALRATTVSMIVGLIFAVITALVLLLTKGRKAVYDNGDPEDATGFRPWMLFGGALAIVIVCGNAIAAPILGTGIVTILNLVGMMGAGLLIDAVGFLGIEKQPVTFIKVAGMILMIAGAALITF